MNSDVIQVIKDMLDNEDAIRDAAREGKQDFDVPGWSAPMELTEGSCDVILNQVPCDLFDEYSDWLDGEYSTSYPVGAEGTAEGHSLFSKYASDDAEQPNYMWGEGDYADARWEFLQEVYDTLTEGKE